MSILDRAIEAVAPQWGLQRRAARARLEMAGTMYRGADYTRHNADWVLGVDGADAPGWERRTLRDRSRDLNRNNPIAAGATDTLGMNIVGQGLRPQSRLRSDVLGIHEKRAEELQRQIELAWNAWTPLAGADNRLDFDEIQFLVLRKVVEDGEVLAVPAMADEAWRPLGRCLEIVEADRLGSGSVVAGRPDTGITMGPRGEPLTYHIRKAGKDGALSTETHSIDARDKAGRPKVLHVYPVRRPGQVRGVPFFAPVIDIFRNVDKYVEAEVLAARVAACLAVFVTKTDPFAGSDMGAAKAETGTGKPIQSIQPASINYLGTGESINVVDPRGPGDNFDPFITSMLRMMGLALGLPYELLVKDFSKTNYSSARAALLEGRRMFTFWRKWLARKFSQPVWELVVEEAVLRGMVDIPVREFARAKAEYCRAMWIGGGWGWVDPVKEVQASDMAIKAGLSTLAEECAGQGRDWEENLEQLQRERRTAKERGLDLGLSKGPDKPGKENTGGDDAGDGSEDRDGK